MIKEVISSLTFAECEGMDGGCHFPGLTYGWPDALGLCGRVRWGAKATWAGNATSTVERENVT